MKQFNVDDFQIHKNYVIEASAGTGKTYNIVEIVNKLVNEYNIPFEKLLIVTYTEKAAGELKNRIRTKTERKEVENATIGTIHSFCKEALKLYPITSKMNMNLDLVDDSALIDFIQRYFREGKFFKELKYLYTIDLNPNMDALQEVFISALDKYYLDSNFKEDPSIISLFSMDDEFFQILRECKTNVALQDILANHREMEEYYNILANCSDAKSQAFIDSLKPEELFNFEGTVFKKSSNWPKDEVSEEAFNYFKNLKNDFKKQNKLIEQHLVHTYLPDLYKKWQLEKEKNKKQSFDDMIRNVRESILHNEEFKQKLKEKYQYGIIDEFQDTNQKQFDIFSKIFLEDDKHNIIVVGDPKQSIYSFQGADVDVYSKAVQEIEKNNGIKCCLNKNHRSATKIVNSCNKLFSYYNFKNCAFEPSDSRTEKVDLTDHRFLYEGKEIPAFWISDEEVLSNYQFSRIAVQQIVDCCTKDRNGKTKLQVRSKDDKDFRNVSFKDFVVLSRVRSETNAMVNALKKSGIPFIKYKDTTLFKGKECSHWIVMLNAISTPDFTGSNRNIFKKALFTSFFGLSIRELNDKKYEKDDSYEMKLFIKWKLLALNRKWEDLFDDIIVSTKLVENMNTLSEIQSLGIYKQIGNYCIDYLSNSHTLDELITNLMNLSKGASTEDDENGSLVERSTNFDCVQIMTMHASKGLQFPVVISFGGFVGANNLTKAFINKEKNRNILSLKKEKECEIRSIEEIKRLFYVALTRAQFINIIPNIGTGDYPFIAESIKYYKKENVGDYRLVVDNIKSFSTLKQEVSIILKDNQKSEETIEDKKMQDKVNAELIRFKENRKFSKHSYSSLSHPKIEQELLDIAGEETIDKEGFLEEGLSFFDTLACSIQSDTLENDVIKNYYYNSVLFPKGAKIGTALHEIFERIDFTKENINLKDLILERFKRQNILLEDKWVQYVTKIIENTLHAKLPLIVGNQCLKKTFSLSSIPNSSRKNEIEFNFNVINQKLKNYCNGFMDLLFKQDINGTTLYSILDWKSDSLNEDFVSYSSNDSIKTHVDNHYSIQRTLYSYCLIKWLKGQYKDLTEQEIFNKHFGGIYYVFIKGCFKETGNGIYAQTWKSFKELETSFKEIVSSRIGGQYEL